MLFHEILIDGASPFEFPLLKGFLEIKEAVLLSPKRVFVGGFRINSGEEDSSAFPG